MREIMDYLIMNYFDGIDFLGWGDSERYSTTHSNRRFEGYYGIQYNHSGPLEFAVGGGKPAVVEGAWAFISQPGETYHYASPSGTTRHHSFVCFKGPRVKTFIKKGLLPLKQPNTLVRVRHSEGFLSAMLALQKRLADSNGGDPRSVLMLEDMLLRLHEEPASPPGVSTHLKGAFERLADEIRKAPQLEWDMRREAGLIGISYPHFRRLFKQLFGDSPWEFVINARLRKASKLLISTDSQISEVAEKCGFSDPFYFSRLFKKRHHFPPDTYRREFRDYSTTIKHASRGSGAG